MLKRSYRNGLDETINLSIPDSSHNFSARIKSIRYYVAYRYPLDPYVVFLKGAHTTYA